MEEVIKLRSSIKASYKRQKLLKGFGIAFIGALILLYSALFVSEKFLNVWGIPLFFSGIGFIALGLVPYRRLNKLEIHPHELLVDEKNLLFCLSGKKTILIPRNIIQQMKHIDDKNTYGIALWLKKPLPEKICLFDPKFNIEKYQRKSLLHYQCDLFLPFFSLSSFREVDSSQ